MTTIKISCFFFKMSWTRCIPSYLLRFSLIERTNLNATLELILNDLNVLKLSSQATYDDFSEEFQELKDLYFLPKKNWVELYLGKMTDMVASGVISETLSKDLVSAVKRHYPDLIV